MFGLVMTNDKALSENGRKRYSDYYCGVCAALRKNYGVLYGLTLNYDIAFLALVLSDVCGAKERKCKTRCLSRCGKKENCMCAESEIIDYAADMNIILSYHKLCDDWRDDKNIFAYIGAALLKKGYVKASGIHPEKSEKAEKLIAKLSELEKSGEPNADKAAEPSAEMLAEIFSYGERAEELSEFGYALGKFIYIADACIDFKADLKRKRYNPMTFTEKSRFDFILDSLMGECEKTLKKIPEAYNDEIVKNIIYSGIWTKYETVKARKK